MRVRLRRPDGEHITIVVQPHRSSVPADPPQQRSPPPPRHVTIPVTPYAAAAHCGDDVELAVVTA